MPKLVCLCDNVINLQEIPNAHEHLMISDIEFDNIYADCIPADPLYEKFKIVVKCDKCHRLHVFWNGFENPPAIYKLEEYWK